MTNYIGWWLGWSKSYDVVNHWNSIQTLYQIGKYSQTFQIESIFLLFFKPSRKS